MKIFAWKVQTRTQKLQSNRKKVAFSRHCYYGSSQFLQSNRIYVWNYLLMFNLAILCDDFFFVVIYSLIGLMVIIVGLKYLGVYLRTNCCHVWLLLSEICCPHLLLSSNSVGPSSVELCRQVWKFGSTYGFLSQFLFQYC